MKFLKFYMIAITFLVFSCSDKKPEENTELEKATQEIENLAEEVEKSTEEIAKEINDLEEDLKQLDSIIEEE